MAGRRLLKRLDQHRLHLRIGNLASRARPRLVVQTIKPVTDKTLAPLANSGQRHPELTRDLAVGQAVRARQHDPGPQRQRLRRFRPPGQTLQRLPFRLGQFQQRQLRTTAIAHQPSLPT